MKNSVTADMLMKCFGAIPRNARTSLFAALFRLVYYLSPRYRLIATHNLKCAFPEKSMKDIGAIVKGVYRTMGVVAADFFEIPSLTRENLGNLVEIHGREHCIRALEKNKGLLMFGAHFGNWELEAIAVSLAVKPVDVIYRPLDNRFLDTLVAQVRASTGNTTVPKDRAMRPMMRTLKNNGILGILIDQNVAWQEGVFVDFFGRPACTTDGLALLALHTEAPVIGAYMVRLENGKYRLMIGEEVEVVRTGNKSADVLTNTQNFTKVIEDTVRMYPDQWLWVHHRWKTKASQVPETAKKAGSVGE
jgi:KDO2-lipid IV(A) lauroyltransferase